MKTKNPIFLLIVALLTLVTFTSCNKDDDGRKITDYQELTVTVASTKLTPRSGDLLR